MSSKELRELISESRDMRLFILETLGAELTMKSHGDQDTEARTSVDVVRRILTEIFNELGEIRIVSLWRQSNPTDLRDLFPAVCYVTFPEGSKHQFRVDLTSSEVLEEFQSHLFSGWSTISTPLAVDLEGARQRLKMGWILNIDEGYQVPTQNQIEARIQIVRSPYVSPGSTWANLPSPRLADRVLSAHR